jgi:3D (Asp-Asp-Asp) domain-containing protein
MRRILACLATLSLAVAATATSAQGYDPLGDLIAAVNQSALENATAWGLKATIYHLGNGMSTRDSMGCPVSPLRTAAIDRAIVSRGAILFIKETVGMPLPGGGVHDGYWYASDTGRLIQGQRIDLFSGANEGSMQPLWPLNLKTLTVSKVGEFTGCPPIDGGRGHTVVAQAQTSPSGLDEGALEHKVAGTSDRTLVEPAVDQQRLQVGQDRGAAAQHQPVALRVEVRQSDIVK